MPTANQGANPRNCLTVRAEEMHFRRNSLEGPGTPRLIVDHHSEDDQDVQERGGLECDNESLPDPADVDVNPDYDTLTGRAVDVVAMKANQRRLDRRLPKKGRSKKWSERKVE